MREGPEWVRRQRGGNCAREPVLWFPWEGTGEAGRAGLGLAGLSDLRCAEAVPDVSYPGLSDQGGAGVALGRLVYMKSTACGSIRTQDVQTSYNIETE